MCVCVNVCVYECVSVCVRAYALSWVIFRMEIIRAVYAGNGTRKHAMLKPSKNIPQTST